MVFGTLLVRCLESVLDMPLVTCLESVLFSFLRWNIVEACCVACCWRGVIGLCFVAFVGTVVVMCWERCAVLFVGAFVFGAFFGKRQRYCRRRTDRDTRHVERNTRKGIESVAGMVVHACDVVLE